ncbi:MAG: NifU family protein [Bacteroidota bacterium]|nr:NifU family protein [Bacteroidota bacterium]
MLKIEDVDLTPNPQALKFVVNETLLKFEARNFTNKDEAIEDSLASGIFDIEGVKSVFYMENFITVEKDKETGWGNIQKPLISLLDNFEVSSIPAEKDVPELNEKTSELVQKINEVLDVKVRPALAGDGGGLRLVSVSGKIVTIHYQGACGSCPSAINGTLRAIEGLLQRDVDPSIRVIAG